MNEKDRFKPYDKVLIRFSNHWVPTIYSYYNEILKKHMTLSGVVYPDEIKHFEEESLETVEEPVEYNDSVIVKENEYVIASTDIKYLREGCCGRLLRFKYINKENKTIICYDPSNDPNIGGCTAWYYILPLSKFDPKNIIESRKHILYVLNGKLVNYHK